MTDPEFVQALSVLSLNPEDVLLVKTGVLDPDPKKAIEMLNRLNEILRHTFANKFHNQVIVVPPDMDMEKVTPQPLKVEFKRVRPDVQPPVSVNPGYILFAPDGVVLEPGQQFSTIVPTGIALSIPAGYHGRITGLNGNRSIVVIESTVSSNYRHEIGVNLHNIGPNQLSIAPGEEIARLIIERHYDATFTEQITPPEATSQ